MTTVSLCFLLFAAVLCTFLPVLRGGFVYDDTAYVLQNTQVLSGLSGKTIQWAFTSLEAGFWHPLTWLSLLLDQELYGLEPWGYHLTAILLHAANSVLLFLALQKMTETTWRSAFVAACFGLHPLHVESVAWISERKDVLSTFFWMLTMLFYGHYAQESTVKDPKSKVCYVLALFSFICGLMSKTMVVTLPLILFLLDWWPLQRFSLSVIKQDLSTIRRLLREKVPFLAAALVCGLITIYAERRIGALASRAQNPFEGRLHNALRSYLTYLYQTFWPADLAVHYPYPVTFGFWPTAGNAVLLLTISAAVVWAARKQAYCATGWLWYVVTLLPVIGLIQVGAFSRADRFSYVPLIGIFLLVTWAFCDFTKHWRYRAPVLSTVGIVASLICASLTRCQTRFWKNDETLWLHALAVTKQNATANYNLGVAYFNQGVTLAEEGAFDEAIRYYEMAIKLSPEKEDAHSSVAYALLKTGKPAEAAREYELSLRLNPGDAEAHNNLGHILARQGRLEEALHHLTEALRLKPNYPEAHDNLGAVLAGLGRYAEAAAEFETVLRLKPDYPQARQKLERVLAARQREPR